MFKINELNRIYLGVQGENAARTIVIDVSDWLQTYPNGTVSIWSKRNGENTNYTPNGLLFDADLMTISWTPDGVDTFYAGAGRCGIILTESGKVRKSKDIETFVTESDADIPGSGANAFDYDRASNKPKMNGVEMQGNQTMRDLDCFDDTNMESTVKTMSASKIKTELDKKIDKAWKPSSNGTLDQILRSNGDGTTRWDAAATQTEVANAVDAWMTENVPSGTTIAIDRSLTASNAAAPADLAGDLKSALSIQEKYIYTNLVKISDILTNKIVKNQAMQSAGVAEYETANNICSTPVLTLCPGEYYIRMPWTSSAIVATWNKDTGDQNGYPVGIMAITKNSAGVTQRTTGYGVDVFEYKLTLNYNAYVVASGQMQNDQYKFLFTISRASLNGTDDYYLDGENALLNDAVVRQLDWLKRDDCRDYLIANKQKKAPSTVVADASYNLPLVSARLNVTVGPIYFHDDVEIEGDNTIEYQVYFLFLNNNHAQTSYTKLYNGNFTTGKHIIGVNKEYTNKIKYYIVLKYANGSVPVNVEEMCSHLKVTPVYGKNPLGIMHVRFWNESDGYEPAGTGSTVESRLWFRTSIPFHSMVYFKNYDVVYSSHHSVSGNISNYDEVTMMDHGEATFLVRHRNPSATTLMQEFASFDDLYNYLGFTVEPVDFKSLQGARVMERLPLDDQLIVGNGIKEDIENSLVISGEGIDFSHVPSLNINSGVAYLAFQASASHSETDNTTSIYLAEIDIANNAIDNIYKIAGVGTYGGVTFDAQCTSPMSVIVGDNVHIVFYGKSNSDGFAFHTTFSIISKTFTTEKCNIVVNGVQYQLNSSNFFEKVGAPNGIRRLNYEIIFSEFQTSDDTTWYSAITSGNYKDSITPILSTTDFTNWQVSDVLPAECACDGEMQFILVGNYYYGASRHIYSDQTICVWKYDRINKRVVESMQISDCASRPTFYKNASNNIILVHGLQERYALEFIQINTSVLPLSKSIAVLNNYRTGFTSFDSYNGDIYMAIQGYPNNYGPKICFLKLPE